MRVALVRVFFSVWVTLTMERAAMRAEFVRVFFSVWATITMERTLRRITNDGTLHRGVPMMAHPQPAAPPQRAALPQPAALPQLERLLGPVRDNPQGDGADDNDDDTTYSSMPALTSSTESEDADTITGPLVLAFVSWRAVGKSVEHAHKLVSFMAWRISVLGVCFRHQRFWFASQYFGSRPQRTVFCGDRHADLFNFMDLEEVG